MKNVSLRLVDFIVDVRKLNKYFYRKPLRNRGRNEFKSIKQEYNNCSYVIITDNDQEKLRNA